MARSAVVPGAPSVIVVTFAVGLVVSKPSTSQWLASPQATDTVLPVAARTIGALTAKLESARAGLALKPAATKSITSAAGGTSAACRLEPLDPARFSFNMLGLLRPVAPCWRGSGEDPRHRPQALAVFPSRSSVAPPNR